MHRSLHSYQQKRNPKFPTSHLQKSRESTTSFKGRIQYHNSAKVQSPNVQQKNAISINEDDPQNPNEQSEDPMLVMEHLLKMQKQCEKKGKYVEAESFKRKLQHYKQQIQKFEYESMQEKHHKQQSQIDDAHHEEMNQFQAKWEATMQQLFQEIKNIEEEMVSRHQSEAEQQKSKDIEDFETDRHYKFRQSAQLLNLRKIEQQLAKQENYMQAHQVQQKSQKIQKQEYEKWKREQAFRGKNIQSVIKAKHQNQIKAMRQRIQLLVDEKKKQQQKQKEKLILKYQNVVKELQYQQNQEMLRFNKNLKLAQIERKATVPSSSSKFGNTMSKSKFSIK